MKTSWVQSGPRYHYSIEITKSLDTSLEHEPVESVVVVEDLPGGDVVAVETVWGEDVIRGRREAEDVVAHVVETQVNIPLVLNHMQEDQFDFPLTVRADQAITDAVSNQRTLSSTSSMIRGICCKSELVGPFWKEILFPVPSAMNSSSDLTSNGYVVGKDILSPIFHLVSAYFNNTCRRCR